MSRRGCCFLIGVYSYYDFISLGLYISYVGFIYLTPLLNGLVPCCELYYLIIRPEF